MGSARWELGGRRALSRLRSSGLDGCSPEEKTRAPLRRLTCMQAHASSAPMLPMHRCRCLQGWALRPAPGQVMPLGY